MSQGIRIAVDGYSSTGKSTMARKLASILNYRYIDTGAMYRALTLWSIKNDLWKGEQLQQSELLDSLSKVKLDFQFSEKHQQAVIHLNGENVEDEIRGSKVASKVSILAQISEVRKFLVAQQQEIAEVGSVVMDGRDIGSVVIPKAELKIFMTADPEIRTQRRFDELKSKGQTVDIDAVRTNLAERDHLDTSREDSPLIQTEDAMVLDNSDLSRDEQLEIAKNWAIERGA